jgi:drug/metabolite transporter (DMT)-like permease
VGDDGESHAVDGWTDLVITPERGVRAVDGLLTGWHEPEASHLLMLEAIAGRALLEDSYEASLAEGYLWHEFGDVHLLLPCRPGRIPPLAVTLGLLVALTYGTGDFLGGLASKRNPPTSVVAASQSVGLVVMVVLVAIDGRAIVWGDFAAGAAAGSVGLLGVVLLYRGLAKGTMSVVAPITAVGAGVLPLAWGLLTGDRPSALALVGVAAALTAVTLVSAADAAEEAGRVPRREIALALAAGAAFGTVFVLLGTTDARSGMWPVLGARLASVVLLSTFVVATRRSWRPAPGTVPTVAGAGVLDASANALYLVATREGLLSLVSVLSALYPAATIVLARIVLAERMNRVQLIGIALALAGVAMIAAG